MNSPEGSIDLRRIAAAVSHPGIDPRSFVSLAIVTKISVEETGVICDVTLMPSQLQEAASLSPLYGGAGFGFYTPLEEGQMVVVVAPEPTSAQCIKLLQMGVQDVLASDGYVQEDYVKQLAAEAGFRFDGSSEINANPKDDHNHPFGVWTLPPVRRSSLRGQPADPNFDHAKYDAVGESDRMTLRFVKPGSPRG